MGLTDSTVTPATVVLPLRMFDEYLEDVKLDGQPRPEAAGVYTATTITLGVPNYFGYETVGYHLQAGKTYMVLHVFYNSRKVKASMSGSVGLKKLGEAGGEMRWAVLFELTGEAWQLDYNVPGSHGHSVGASRLSGVGTSFESRDEERRIEEAPFAWPEDKLLDTQYRVKFSGAPWDTNQPVTKVRGKTAMALNSGTQPKLGEEWIVEIARQSNSGQSYLLRLVRKVEQPNAGPASIIIPTTLRSVTVRINGKEITEGGEYTGTYMHIRVPSAASWQSIASTMQRLVEGEKYLILQQSGFAAVESVEGAIKIFDFSDQHGSSWAGLFLLTGDNWSIRLTLYGYRNKPDRTIVLSGDKSTIGATSTGEE